MLLVFGSRQIRNRATLGGNLVTASPIGDSAPVLLALEAKVVLASATGERALPLDEFFVSYRKTALAPDEILKSILIPRIDPEARSVRRFYKVSKRREMDISTVAGGFAVSLGESGTIVRARLAFGGVAAMPARARQTEQALIGKRWRPETVEEVLPILASEFTPISDVRGSAAYRAQLIKTLLRKFFAEEPGLAAASPAEKIARQLAQPDESPPHESGHKHVTGEAIYVDDVAQATTDAGGLAGLLRRMRTRKFCGATQRRRATMPGIVAVLLAEDVPGLNDVGAVRHDEILLADKEAFYHGQIVALVVGETQEALSRGGGEGDRGIRAASADFHDRGSDRGRQFSQRTELHPAGRRRRGPNECAAEVGRANFPLAARIIFISRRTRPGRSRARTARVFISSSTQHPSEVQHIVAHLLGLPMHSVVVECPRMGGGFGGKETQAASLAALAALAATKTGRKVRVRFNRDQDMMITGKRHPFLGKFEVGFDREGMLLAAQSRHSISNGGWSLDLSRAVTDRAVFHLDNAYYIPHVEFSGRRRQNQPRLEHRLPRFRRTAGDARDRGNHGPNCARRLGSAPGSRQATQSLSRERARRTPRPTARRSRTTGSSASGRS